MPASFPEDLPTPEGFLRVNTTRISTGGFAGNGWSGWCQLLLLTVHGEPNIVTTLTPNGVQTLASQLTSVLAAMPTAPPIRWFNRAGDVAGSITYGPTTKVYFGQPYELLIIQALGVLVIRANLLDQDLIGLYTALTGVSNEQASNLYYATSNMKARLDQIRSLLPVSRLKGDDINQIKEALDEVKTVSDRRNDLVHARWTFRKGKHRAVLLRPLAKTAKREITVNEQHVLDLVEAYGLAHLSLVSAAGCVERMRSAAANTARTPSSTDPTS